MTSDKSFVDPSSLSLPSPASDGSVDSPHLVPESLPGPSRKRARTDMTPEERKEARAHRNRIAAQNSRDKRKAQFTALERRVAELEEENRQLRAGMSGVELHRADEKRKSENEREKAREQENAELKERIRSLEKGWEAVMKVLTAQGLPASVVPSPTPASSSTATTLPTPATSSKSSSSPPTTPQSPANNTTTTFPVLVPASPVFPITPSPSFSSKSIFSEETESTRHLARVATVTAIPPVAPLQRASPVPAAQQPTAPVSGLAASQPANSRYETIEAWLSATANGSYTESLSTPINTEINTASVQVPVIAGSQPTLTLPTTAEASLMLDMGIDMSMDMGVEMGMGAGVEVGAEWEKEAELQQLLDMFSYVQEDMVSPETSTTNAMEDVSKPSNGINTALGLELCGGMEWVMGRDASTASGVGVF